MDEGEYFSCEETKKLTRVSSQTLRRWDKESKIRSIKNVSGTRMYNKQDVYKYIGRDYRSHEKQKIAYCRISSKKQSDDLERQKDFYRSKYPNHELVTDIGSGINWKRKGLKTILEQAMSGKIEEVVVAHRDRLCRFAFELIEFILQTNGVKLIVLDGNSHSEKNPSGSIINTKQSSDTELADDILSIIHVYSCRQMGKRRYTTTNNKTSDPKSEKTENLPNKRTENSI
jgi:predicted site-specific integrase-resolvase